MLDNMMRYLEVALPLMRDERTTLDREAQLIEAYLAAADPDGAAPRLPRSTSHRICGGSRCRR